nr:ribonuclease domain-containing protein [Sulfuricystis multivorans]
MLAAVLGLAQAEEIARQALPVEAREVLALIAGGGPFPYRRDGIVFGNYERHLPPAPRGYYREYTVPTPGAGNRGARRIVCGGQVPQRPDVCYYSPDHYRSFRRIVE